MIGTELLFYPLCLTVDLFLSWAILKRKEVSREKIVLFSKRHGGGVEKVQELEHMGEGWEMPSSGHDTALALMSSYQL